MIPAAGIHVSDLNQLRLHQPVHFRGLEQQVVTGLAPPIAGDYQVGNLARMVHRILPATHACTQEGCDALRVGAGQFFRREQRIAVEIDAACPWREQVVWHAGLFKQIGLVGRIPRHRADLAREQIVEIEGMRHHLDTVERQLLLLQVGDQFRLVRQQHNLLAGKFVHGCAAAPGCNQHQRRMLQDRRQHDHRLPLSASKREFGSTDAIVGRTGEHRIDRVAAFLYLLHAHVEAGLAIKPPLDGRVVAGKLELMFPVELQGDLLQVGGSDGRSRRHRAGEQQNCEREERDPQAPSDCVAT